MSADKESGKSFLRIFVSCMWCFWPSLEPCGERVMVQASSFLKVGALVPKAAAAEEEEVED